MINFWNEFLIIMKYFEIESEYKNKDLVNHFKFLVQ